LLARAVLIAQISDLHITSPRTLAYGRVDTAAALARSIDTLNRLSPRPDLVVISADTSPIRRCRRNYKHAKTLLSALQMPFAAIPGNHDRRIPMRKAFPDPAYMADGGSPI
jgi:Icc protein